MTLQHSLLTITKLLDEFFLSYGHNPSNKEKEVYIEWAKNLTENELKYALNGENHRIESTGQRKRPNLPTLRDIVSEKRIEQHDMRWQEEYSLLGDDEECWYCTEGYVIDVFEDQGDWFKRNTGRCKCPKGDNTGYLSKRKPVEPSQRLQEYARERSVGCVVAADLMTVERNTAGEMLYEPDLSKISIPF